MYYGHKISLSSHSFLHIDQVIHFMPNGGQAMSRSVNGTIVLNVVFVVQSC